MDNSDEETTASMSSESTVYSNPASIPPPPPVRPSTFELETALFLSIFEITIHALIE